MIVRSKVTQGGRVVIPADWRRQLGIAVGEDVNMELDNDSIQITTSQAALKRIQDRLRNALPKGVSLVDELIAERRREAENE